MNKGRGTLGSKQPGGGECRRTGGQELGMNGCRKNGGDEGGLLPIELAQVYLREMCGTDRQGRVSMQQRSVQTGTAPVPFVEITISSVHLRMARASSSRGLHVSRRSFR